MIQQMTVDEIMHWIGELTTELARRAALADLRPAAPTPPWMQAPAAPEPPRWQPPRQEPKARPFTSTTQPMVNLPPVPEGGLPPGTPLTRAPVGQPAADPVAALIAQLQAQLAGQQTATKPPTGVVTTTAKTDPETARVFLGVPPRPDGAPPINGSGLSSGVVVEPV